MTNAKRKLTRCPLCKRQHKPGHGQYGSWCEDCRAAARRNEEDEAKRVASAEAYCDDVIAKVRKEAGLD